MSNKKEKMLLIEACEFAPQVTISNKLKESIKLAPGKNDTLILRNVPCTILNRKNLNGRIYSTEVVQQAIDEAQSKIKQKQLLSQACEHPEGSFVSPTTASHVVIAAYIKKGTRLKVEGEDIVQDVLFMDLEVLNTQEGKNLRALIEGGCSVGTSIRGLGDMDGNQVTDYELLGVDFVGQPSSSTYTNMPVMESVKVESVNSKALDEAFVLSTTSTNTVRDLAQAAEISGKLDNIGYGTVTKTSTKVDEETNPKTGATTTLVSLEAETSDEVTSLDQALVMAKKAMLNPLVHVDSVTIENVEEEGDSTKESVSGKEEGLITGDINVGNGNDVDIENNADLSLMGEEADDIASYEVIVFSEDEDGRTIDMINDLSFEKLEDAEAFASKSMKALDTKGRADIYAVKNIASEEPGAHEEDYTLIKRADNEGNISIVEDTEKQNGKWVNKGAEGTHGKFDTKKAADAQRKAMFANGYKESTENEGYVLMETTDNKDTKGRKFVLKTPNGYVAMNGNAINFVKKPSEALQFIEGKEESGIVHLSNIEKILDTMGIYEVERYFKREGKKNMGNTQPKSKEEGLITGDINIGNGNDIDMQNDLSMPLIPESKMQEDANNDTKYVAIIYSNNGADQNTTPITATELDSVRSEVANLYQMKVKSLGNDIKLIVRDNENGTNYNFDPKNGQLLAMTEAIDDTTEVNDNKVSMKLDNETTIEKDFDTPQQATLAKAAIDAGKVDPSILIKEEEILHDKVYIVTDGMNIIYPYEGNTDKIESDEGDEYSFISLDEFEDNSDINPVDYSWSSLEEAQRVANDLNNTIGFEDITFTIVDFDVPMNEKLYKEPDEASDPYVDKSLNDSAMEEAGEDDSVEIIIRDIDWNIDSFGEDNVNDIIEVLSKLPDEIRMTIHASDFDDASNVKNTILARASEERDLPQIKDANIDLAGMTTMPKKEQI